LSAGFLAEVDGSKGSAAQLLIDNILIDHLYSFAFGNLFLEGCRALHRGLALSGLLLDGLLAHTLVTETLVVFGDAFGFVLEWVHP